MNTSLTIFHYGSVPASPEVSDSFRLTFTTPKLACRTNTIRTKQEEQLLTFLGFANTFGKFSFFNENFFIKSTAADPSWCGKRCEIQVLNGI